MGIWRPNNQGKSSTSATSSCNYKGIHCLWRSRYSETAKPMENNISFHPASMKLRFSGGDANQYGNNSGRGWQGHSAPRCFCPQVRLWTFSLFGGNLKLLFQYEWLHSELHHWENFKQRHTQVWSFRLCITNYLLFWIAFFPSRTISQAWYL